MAQYYPETYRRKNQEAVEMRQVADNATDRTCKPHAVRAYDSGDYRVVEFDGERVGSDWTVCYVAEIG